LFCFRRKIKTYIYLYISVCVCCTRVITWPRGGSESAKNCPTGIAQQGSSLGPIVPSGPLTFLPSDTNCLTRTSTNPHWCNNLKIVFSGSKSPRNVLAWNENEKNNSNKILCWKKKMKTTREKVPACRGIACLLVFI